MFLNEKEILFFDGRFSTLSYYENFIIYHLKRGDKIPNRVYEKYFLLLSEFKETGKINAIKKHGKIISNALKERFEKEEYCFLGNGFSFEDMVIQITERYYENTESMRRWNKEDWIQFLYYEMSEYRNKYLNKKEKKNFSDYKMHVLAAFLTKELGFKLSEKKELTNKDLFNLARNAVSKM